MEVKAMLSRVIDFLKSKGITAVFTDLTRGADDLEGTRAEISSLMDTWILLRDIELQGERNRGLYILKSRGMSHSNQIREFLLSDRGIDLVDVYTGSSGVLTGTARMNLEEEEKAEGLKRSQDIERRKREILQKRKAFNAMIAKLRADFEAEKDSLEAFVREAEYREKAMLKQRRRVARGRGYDDNIEQERPDVHKEND